LSKQFRNILYIKNSLKRGDDKITWNKVGGEKMLNAIYHDYRTCQVFPLR